MPEQLRRLSFIYSFAGENQKQIDMEQLNRIELRGLVGSVNVQTYPQGKVAHFTLATSQAYHDRNGGAVIDTQWHNVTLWEGKGVDLDCIQKGSKIYVVGRLKTQKFAGADGTDRYTVDVQASRGMLIDREETLSSEM